MLNRKMRTRSWRLGRWVAIACVSASLVCGSDALRTRSASAAPIESGDLRSMSLEVDARGFAVAGLDSDDAVGVDTAREVAERMPRSDARLSRLLLRVALAVTAISLAVFVGAVVLWRGSDR